MHPPRLFATLDPFVESGAVMGRKVANAGFLDALLAADPFDAYHFFMPSPRERDIQAGLLAARHPDLAGQGKFKVLTRLDLPRALAADDYAVFHLSDCITSQPRLAAARNALAKTIFPITATTHSLSYAAYGREFLAHLWPGTTGRDAIVATSEAGRAVVAGFFQSLRRGYGLDEAAYPAPRLATIPLGVDPAVWESLAGEARAAARTRLGLDPEAVVLLVFGRLSHSSKMDLLPLFRAVQRLIADGCDPAGLCLVAAGWTEDEDGPFTDILAGLAGNIGLPFRLVPRPSEAAKRELFGISDIFVSLADNPQETFGLTILEAMAAGLPVVASDYDGYRDTVVPGVTGYLAPTLGLADTGPRDVLAPLCYDNHTHLLLAQGLAVDVAAVAAALKQLVADPGLRRAMGRAGRERAGAVFTWQAVVARHLALWEALAAAPIPDRASLRRLRHPAALAYGELFGGYPTAVLSDAVRLTWTRTGRAVYRGRDFPVVYEGLGPEVSLAALRTLLFLARSGCPGLTLAARLAAAEPGLDAFAARFHVVWALKQDLLEKEAV
ncbi:glycosyl transferase group 1 [Solidesulfovibrio carbinoliphilus subsp. oakridgensis]|uniref:Glycosyl transferase group 1 n=1 Tax=Solidesulfovibrio carbinoliphilus subsp. oakridgensis TaxID=694327 RepID=G7Q475_9BACT|nr:glycosyltransferase family 4 protein [Solidesulfovibrio carbinoliphilus]EHJ46943.1 glycosyl transferase group 1 [Solidesulfovibrio carbinoliphilus subsp. oakridgensis]